VNTQTAASLEQTFSGSQTIDAPKAVPWFVWCAIAAITSTLIGAHWDIAWQDLPSMPAGRYRLFGDIVHENGLPETLIADVQLPEIPGAGLEDDDSEGAGPPLAEADPNRTEFALAGGGRMVWIREPGLLRTKRVAHFTFRVEDEGGRPASDLEPLPHLRPVQAAWVHRDGGLRCARPSRPRLNKGGDDQVTHALQNSGDVVVILTGCVGIGGTSCKCHRQ
jgi:hypothetical protein